MKVWMYPPFLWVALEQRHKFQIVCLYFSHYKPTTMSARTFANDMLNDAVHSSFPLNEKVNEGREDEEKSSSGLDYDDALDDSSSSYCTALCSLDSEDSEDEILFTEPLCEDASSESSHSEAASETSKISSVNYVPLQECKTKEVLHPNEKTKITVLNLNLTNINSVVAVPGSAPTPSLSKPEFTLMPWDYFRGKNAAQIHTKPFQSFGGTKPRFASKSSVTRMCNKDMYQAQQSGIKPKEDSAIHQQSFIKSHYKLDSGKFILGNLKWEGEEEQGTGVGKEQAKLSLKAENRNLPANCTSTLTPKLQKSGILPSSYVEHIPPTRNQHQSQSLPVSQSLQKQSRQGVWLSALLPPTPSSSSRKHCSTGDNIRGTSSMATAAAETTTHVRTLTSLDSTKSSFSEANYMDVFNYSSSTSLSCDGDLHDCSTDAESFKLPVMPTKDHNTSACSETSSFECIDVALENCEQINRIAKTVPKRQIQLKSREDSHVSENNAFPEVSSPPSRPRELLQRQHSTPAAFHQDSHGSESMSDQTERKQKFQKSLSLDETAGKTKMASCIIKSVLLKRMQHEQNLGTQDVIEQDFGPLKASNDDYLSSSAEEVSTESNQGNLPTAPYLSSAPLLQSPTLKTQTLESETTTSNIKEHISVSSKTQPKLIAKHGFNPLFCALGRIQMQGNYEITTPNDTKNEKLGLCKDACFTSQSTEEQSKAQNLSAVINRAVGKLASVKTTPEECCTALEAHKQQNVKNQLITRTEKQEKTVEEKEGTLCPPTAACSSYNLVTSTLEEVKPQSASSNPEKDQEYHREEPSLHGQSGNLHIQSLGKFKGIAPVHVVRDIRSLVKNIYTQSFRGSSEAAQGLRAKDEKPHVQKKISPKALDRVKLFASRGNANSHLKSHDDIPHSGLPKIKPISAPKTNSCALSKPQEEHKNLTAISQADVQGSNKNMKQTNRKGVPPPTKNNIVNKIAKKEQSADSNKLGHEKPRNLAEHQGKQQAHRQQHCSSTESSDQKDSCKLSNESCFAAKYVHQTPCLPPGSQNSAGPPSACILTVAPTPVFPSYLYKPNPLGYQTLSLNIGTASYIQGPVFIQTPAHNQPMTTNGSAPLTQSLSLEGKLLAQPCIVDGHSVHQSSSKQTESVEKTLKIPTPNTQQCRTFITTLGAESIQGSSSMLHPEMGGNLAQNPRHMLLDPETGHCFYVDVPQIPQRKMLFDPETCQYVEVVLPQQTFSTAVMTPSCAIPLPSLHIPAMYTPHCLSLVQAHPQVLKPPGP